MSFTDDYRKKVLEEIKVRANALFGASIGYYRFESLDVKKFDEVTGRDEIYYELRFELMRRRRQVGELPRSGSPGYSRVLDGQIQIDRLISDLDFLVSLMTDGQSSST
jgi:hypothetical protein